MQSSVDLASQQTERRAVYTRWLCNESVSDQRQLPTDISVIVDTSWNTDTHTDRKTLTIQRRHWTSTF